MVGLALLNGLIAACSSFTSNNEPVVPPPEGGPAPDAGPSTDGEADASAPDAGNDAAPRNMACPEAGLSPNGMFCDDFNDVPAAPNWHFVALPGDTAGSIALFPDPTAPSPSNSLRATFTSDGGSRSAGIYYDAPQNQGSLECNVAINLTIPPATTLQIAALFLEQSGKTRRVLLVHTNPGATISATVEDVLDDGGLSSSVEGMPVPMVVGWRELSFALVGSSATVVYGGATILASTRASLVVDQAQMALLLGSSGPVALSSVRYDNVRCFIQP